MKYIYTIFCFFLFLGNINLNAQQTSQVKLSNRLESISDDHIFRDPDYFNWGSSILKSNDGKYHMFYSRWNRNKSFLGWLTHSEVAHAVADKPSGPYKYVNTVLKFNHKTFRAGEKITAHNPKIKYFNGQYYLYFISTYLNKSISNDELIKTAHTGYSHPNWNLLRNNQRTFVATSKSLDGEFKIKKHSLLEPEGPIQNIVVNPAIVQGKDKRFYLIVKGDKPGTKKFVRNQAVAVSNYPDKGFSLMNRPVIKDWDTEDMSMWYDKPSKSYYAIFHAHHYLGMMTSKNGLDWEKADDFEVTKKVISLKDGEKRLVPDRMERPFVFVEDDEPKVLAVGVKKSNDSYIVTIPISEKKTFADHWSFIGTAIEEPGYEIWGSSPIIDDEGRVHLFAARWIAESKHDPGWRSHSEIAHYIASSPEGPFKFKEVVLKGTGKDTWDKFGAHNPTIHKVGDKYVLFYIANNNYHQPPHPANQKIGMLVAHSLNGPWKKVGKDGCILAPSKNPKHWTHNASNGVNNPALLQHPEGGYLLYFKSNNAKMGVAFAENIEGPYVMYPKPVTQNSRTIEDGYAFIYNGKICLLTTDNHGIIQEGGGLLWTSDDGIHFDKYERGFYLSEKYMGKARIEQGKILKGGYAKFERPQLLLIEGKPAYLYVPCTCNLNGNPSTASYILKYID